MPSEIGKGLMNRTNGNRTRQYKTPENKNNPLLLRPSISPSIARKKKSSTGAAMEYVQAHIQISSQLMTLYLDAAGLVGSVARRDGQGRGTDDYTLHAWHQNV